MTNKKPPLSRVFPLLVVLASFALPGVANAASGPLSEKQVRTLIEGNTLIGGYGGELYDFSVMPSGRIYGDIGIETGNGRWHFKRGNVYCHEWSEHFDGIERCYQWYTAENGRYLLKNVDSYRDRDLEVWRIRGGLQ